MKVENKWGDPLLSPEEMEIQLLVNNLVSNKLTDITMTDKNKLDTGGPANPLITQFEGPTTTHNYVSDKGMTWLDDMAGRAMQSLVKDFNKDDTVQADTIASIAYEMGMAMLAEKRRLEKEGV